MIRGATGDHEHLVHRPKQRSIHLQLVENDPTRVRHPSGEGVGDGMGLFVDLLEHEGRKTPLLGRLEVPLHLAMLGLDLIALQVDQPNRSRANLDNPVVVDDHHLPGVLQKGGYVRCQIVLAISSPNDQGRSAPCSNDQLGVGSPHHREGQGPLGFIHHPANRLDQRQIGEVAKHVGNNLGVGVADELVSRLDQFPLQLDPVLDDPVVHHHHLTLGIGMGMGVDRVRRPVGRPTGMTDTGDCLRHVLI